VRDLEEGDVIVAGTDGRRVIQRRYEDGTSIDEPLCWDGLDDYAAWLRRNVERLSGGSPELRKAALRMADLISSAK
jgi:hypothetical protein